LAKNTGSIISGFAERWPREIFDIREKKGKLLTDAQDILDSPGVYVLYRDDSPYYIGKTKGKLYGRIYNHANQPGARYYRYWNYFSAYKVDSIEHIDDVEGILISAIPLAANSSNPRFQRIRLPRSIKNLLGRLRRISVDDL
jgi:hypothetical protein